MENFKKMYTLLFNTITTVVDEIDKQNFGIAKDLLLLGQERAEELYISAGGKDPQEAPREDS